MLHYQYLIVGGGMTAESAVRGIREVDPNASIGLISQESDPPYNRPPLTKALWKGKALDTIWRKTDNEGVEFYLGRTAQALDARNKRVDTHDVSYTFDKLLLATGGASPLGMIGLFIFVPWLIISGCASWPFQVKSWP